MTSAELRSLGVAVAVEAAEHTMRGLARAVEGHFRGAAAGEGETMIGISKLYCGTVEPSDPLRYGRDPARLPSHLLQFSADKRPVVVWNVGRRCNLRCVHCYSRSDDRGARGELSTRKGGGCSRTWPPSAVPVVLFSGGEPLLRPDISR